jgi:hypothetical protein
MGLEREMSVRNLMLPGRVPIKSLWNQKVGARGGEVLAAEILLG